MGSSSGSGSFVFGGSLSSSTLSPLAPPFNFDKTYQKPNLTNPSLNFFEAPVYGSVFDPVGPFWTSSSSSPTSIPSYVVPESTAANTSCPTSTGIYSYQVPPYHDPGVICDPFSYTQFENSMSTNADEAAKPYYPPYVYPSPAKDGYVGLGGVKGSGYDLLSNSDSANCTGFGSSSVDHTRGLSFDGDPKLKWGDFRTGVNDGGHGEWKEYAQCFGSKGTVFSGLSGDKSHLPVDASSQIHPFCETTNECLLKQGSHVSRGMDSHQNIPSDSGSFYDIFNGAYTALSLGIGQQDYQSTFDLKSGGISSKCSKLPASDENPHLQKPVLESVASFCGPRTTTTTNDCSIQTGSFVFGCSSTTSTPITRTKFPYVGSNVTAPSTLSGTKVIPGCDSSSQTEPQIPPGFKSRSSIVIKRPLSSSVEPSSTQIGETGNSSVNKDASSDETKLTSIGFVSEVDDAQVIRDNDVRTPGEDSPCWKGASSMRFASFGVSDETQCKVSSAEDINVSMFGISPFSAATSKDHEDSSSMNQKPHRFDLNNRAEVNYINEHEVSSEKSDELLARLAEISKATLQVLNPLTEGEKSKDRTPTEAYTCSRVPFVIGNGICSSPPGNKSSFKLCQSSREVSGSRIDIDMQVKSMMNISEELRAYFRNNPAAAMQNHSETIKCVIDNLSDCISAIDAPMSVSSPGSFPKKPSASEMVNTSESVTADAVKLRRRTEEFLESFPFKDDSIIFGNDNMAKAIKKILLENIEEEETEEHKVLYKNLWIEAEAALCAITAKARLHHMKIEMEKACSTTKAEMGQSLHESTSKDKDSPALVVHDGSSPRTTTSKGQCEVSIINKFHSPNSQVSLNSNKCGGLKSSRCMPTTSPYSLGNNCDGTISDSNDVETSTLARYHIIKSRDDKVDSLKNDCNKSPEEFCLPDNVFSDTFQNQQVLNSVSGSDDVEASVMGRFRILQNQINWLNSMDKDYPTRGQGWSKQVGPSLFGPYPDLTKYDDVKEFDLCVNREVASSQAFKVNNLSSKIFEGWYDNGYSSSEWEHVSKEDLQRQQG